MILRLLGAVLVLVGCGAIGFGMAANYRREEKALRQLIGILDYMECELQYRLTPLPALCRQAAREFGGIFGSIFTEFALEMEAQISPDLSICMSAAMDKCKYIPPICKEMLGILSRNIGRFHLEGQLKGLDGVRMECRRHLETLTSNKDNRLRSYQTLGLCAGAALVILFI